MALTDILQLMPGFRHHIRFIRTIDDDALGQVFGRLEWRLLAS